MKENTRDLNNVQRKSNETSVTSVASKGWGVKVGKEVRKATHDVGRV